MWISFIVNFRKFIGMRKIYYFFFKRKRSVKSNWKHAQQCGFTGLNGRNFKKAPKEQNKKDQNHQNILPVLFRTSHVSRTHITTAYLQLVMQKLVGLTIQLKATGSGLKDKCMIFLLFVSFAVYPRPSTFSHYRQLAFIFLQCPLV